LAAPREPRFDGRIAHGQTPCSERLFRFRVNKRLISAGTGKQIASLSGEQCGAHNDERPAARQTRAGIKIWGAPAKLWQITVMPSRIAHGICHYGTHAVRFFAFIDRSHSAPRSHKLLKNQTNRANAQKNREDLLLSSTALADQVAKIPSANGLNHGKAFYSIGEIAEEFGITLRTLRFYESKGLIHPRREGTSRQYSEEDRHRLGLILQGKRLGFTLTEIRGLLASPKERDGGRSLGLSREQCLEQIALLERQKAEIEDALAELRRKCSLLPVASGNGERSAS